jgi:hypothetical protein
MSGSYFVVDHVSDENKKEGLLESYQMIPVQYDNGQGVIQGGFKRLNFVHWPGIPSPVVHEEWSEDLIFTNIYTPSEDFGDEDDDEDYDDDDYDDEEADFSEEATEAYNDGEEGGTQLEG